MDRTVPPDPQDADTLNGWKEIATYLGKSVRSAQRWEHELGLPVHRLLTPEGGQIIYASRSEIEGWRTTLSPAAAEGSADADDQLDEASRTPPAPVAAAGATAPVASRSHRLAAAIWGLAGLGIGLALGLAVRSFPASEPGIPAIFEFEGNAVVAFTDAGRRLWRHDFGRPAAHPSSARPRGLATDLDGDGTPELLVPVRFSSVLTPSLRVDETDAVFAFAADGRVLWSVQPDITLTDDQAEFTGPWNIRDVAASRIDGGRVYIAYSHHTWRPGVVVEADAAGRWSIRYLQGGRINALAVWPTGSRRFLVAGGTLADPTGTSLALVDLDGPPARSPDSGPALTCPTCPSAPVASMTLFPPSEVTRALYRPYGWINRVFAVGDVLRFATDEGIGSGLVGELSPDLVVTNAKPPTPTGRHTAI
ncbi:MAG: hypothetical protein R2752_22075 [Vicinamibacterales bacterium]